MHQVLLNAFYQHKDALLGFIAKRTGDTHLAQDILQDIYLKLESQKSDNEIKYPKAYLYRIANNLIIDHQRFQSKFVDNNADSEQQNIKDSHANISANIRDTHVNLQVDEISPEAHLAARQRLEIVTEAINELPDKTRDVFKMQRLQQIDKSEVASNLGISVNMVEKHLRRALQYCRDKLYKLEK